MFFCVLGLQLARRDLLLYGLIACLDWVGRDQGSGLSTAWPWSSFVLLFPSCLVVSSSFMEIADLDALPASLLLGPFGNVEVLF